MRAEELLARLAGPGARFREGQLEAIQTAVGGGRALVVQATGWGKSAVYFIATRLLRDQGAGPTILVSPLLALMRNQVDAADRLGIRAATINSTNVGEWRAIEEDLRNDDIDLLLISPERLGNSRFSELLTSVVAPRSGLLVIDEAHCISDWGHDFRPDYRRVTDVLKHMPQGVAMLCTTATANARVVEDVVAQVGGGMAVFRGPLDRPSLHLDAIALPEQTERLAWLALALHLLPGTGIVYCLTKPDVERVTAFLRTQGHDVAAYSGDTDDALRLRLEQDLLENRVKALIATSALGMGYDKPDLGFVVHYQHPGSPVAYYQQVGRAGRAIDSAYGILLVGEEDVEIQDFFIDTAFPRKEHADQVVALLAAESVPRGSGWLQARVNIKKSKLDELMKLLEIEGAVLKDGSGWTRTVRPWAYDSARAERVTALRRAEQAAMAAYPDAPCLMAELRQQLDDPAAAPCGRCSRCTGSAVLDVGPLPARLISAAERFIRHGTLEIEPRKQWPTGLEGQMRKIPQGQVVQPGKALTRWGSAGWGGLVSRGKYGHGHFSDELVEALEGLVTRWSPDPAPTWVTWVPSHRHPELVPSLAQRLAGRLGLPAVEAVSLRRETAQQKQRENSAQQFANVDGAFLAIPTAIHAGPVLLVDDMVDSRWTITVVGAALLEAGAGPVYPLALAVTGTG